MICVDNIIFYISLPFVIIGLINTTVYLCTKKECENQSIVTNEVTLD